jgi:plastocyanin
VSAVPVFCAVFALALALAGCQTDKADARGPRVLELNADTVQVPDSVRVATIRINRVTAAELAPAAVSLRAGDLLRFIAEDGAAHAIAFDGGAMSAEARSFLEHSGQMRSPPFVEAGATWVVSFKGAPPGVYRFRCPTHHVQGTVTVTAR